jgi:hypothetical protein
MGGVASAVLLGESAFWEHPLATMAAIENAMGQRLTLAENTGAPAW